MERSYSRYLLVVLCVAIVSTAIVLVALNAYTNSKHPNMVTLASSDDEISNSYRAGFEAAKLRFEQYGLGINGDTRTLIGSVERISGSTLLVLQQNLMTDAFVSGVSDERQVTINAATKITRETKKSDAQFLAEQQAFAKLAPSPTSQPPVASTMVSIRMSDIKPGDSVRVIAQEDDVTTLASITATEIIVVSK